MKLRPYAGAAFATLSDVTQRRRRSSRWHRGSASRIRRSREPGPPRYKDEAAVLLRSLTPPLTATDSLGLGVMFYLPHVSVIAADGLDA